MEPASTADGITNDFGNHYWAEPVENPAHKLFVFMGGASSIPAAYRTVVSFAAAAGYHAVGLAFHDTDRILDVCANTTDPNCEKMARLEMITGEDVSGVLSVDRANSIESRLTKFLLAKGWTEYVEQDAPRWSEITFAGHSQGAGQATMIGQLHSVFRVVAISGPPDEQQWTAGPRESPSERFWSLVHIEDSSITPMEKHWDNLGLPGAPTNINTASPPYGGSHRLLTSGNVGCDAPDGAPQFCAAAHFSTAVDGSFPAAPLDLRALQTSWCYMLGP